MNIKSVFYNSESYITEYILPLGFFFFLCGILFFSSFSAYHTQIYIFLITPSLILILKKPKEYVLLLSSKTFLLLLALFTYAGLSIFWNAPEVEDFKYIKRLLIILFFILSIIILVKNDEKKLIKLLLFSALIYSLAAYYSIYNDYFIEHKPLSFRMRGLGNLSNPLLSSHIYGIFTTLILAYFFACQRNWKKDLILFIIFTGLISFVFMTHSKTPLVGMSAVFSLLFIMHKNKKTLFFFIALAIISGVYFIFDYGNLTSRGLSYRPEIWSIAIDRIMLNPFFGHGLGTEISISSPSLRINFSDTHNIHIGITYKLGITGLIIWLLILISAFRIYLQNKKSIIAQIGVCLLVYGFTSGMTEGFGFLTRPKEVWFLTWLPISLLLSIEIQQKMKQSSS